MTSLGSSSATADGSCTPGTGGGGASPPRNRPRTAHRIAATTATATSEAASHRAFRRAHDGERPDGPALSVASQASHAGIAMTASSFESAPTARSNPAPAGAIQLPESGSRPRSRSQRRVARSTNTAARRSVRPETNETASTCDRVRGEEQTTEHRGRPVPEDAPQEEHDEAARAGVEQEIRQVEDPRSSIPEPAVGGQAQQDDRAEVPGVGRAASQEELRRDQRSDAAGLEPVVHVRQQHRIVPDELEPEGGQVEEQRETGGDRGAASAGIPGRAAHVRAFRAEAAARGSRSRRVGRVPARVEVLVECGQHGPPRRVPLGHAEDPEPDGRDGEAVVQRDRRLGRGVHAGDRTRRDSAVQRGAPGGTERPSARTRFPAAGGV